MNWIYIFVLIIAFAALLNALSKKPFDLKSLQMIFDLQSPERWGFLNRKGFNTLTGSVENGYWMDRHSYIWGNDSLRFPHSPDEVEAHNMIMGTDHKIEDRDSEFEGLDLEKDFLSYGMLNERKIGRLIKQIEAQGFNLIEHPDIEAEKKAGCVISKNEDCGQIYYTVGSRIPREFQLYHRDDLKIIIERNRNGIAFLTLYHST